MINSITFDSQMAMAGAMSSIFAARGGYVTESVNANECDATNQAPVTEAKKAQRAEQPKKGQKSISGIVSKFHKDFAAKKFGNGRKVLKTCKDGVCECGGQAPVSEADEDVVPQTKKPVEETPVEETPVAPDVAEPETADGNTPVENGEGPDKEVVAHASAVSERIANMRDKLVAELDADDGLELGAQKVAKQGEGEPEEEPVEA